MAIHMHNADNSFVCTSPCLMDAFSRKHASNWVEQPPPSFVRGDGGEWICPKCSAAPYHLRAPGSTSINPPSREFIDRHFAICSGLTTTAPDAIPTYGYGEAGPRQPRYVPPAPCWPSANSTVESPVDWQDPRASLHGFAEQKPIRAQGSSLQNRQQAPQVPPENTIVREVTSPSMEGSPEGPYDGINESGTDQLVLPFDKPLLTDYFYLLIQQLQFCRFSERDRNSRGRKRENLEVGFSGIECRHCAGRSAGRPRKFFWANVDRIANSFAAISDHIIRCRHCPPDIRTALEEAKILHRAQMAKLPKGSQKVFLRRMWRRLHPNAETDESLILDGRPKGGHAYHAEGSSANDQAMAAVANCSSALSDISTSGSVPKPRRVLLAIPGDGQWLSDFDCFIRRSLEVFCASEPDVVVHQMDKRYPISVGQVGIRCVHCASAEGGGGEALMALGPAVWYPQSINGIYENVRHFWRLHLSRCPHLPALERAKLERLQTSASLPGVLRPYYVIAAKELGLYDCPGGIGAGRGSAILDRPVEVTPPARSESRLQYLVGEEAWAAAHMGRPNVGMPEISPEAVGNRKRKASSYWHASRSSDEGGDGSAEEKKPRFDDDSIGE